jgi:hypothetical protein
MSFWTIRHFHGFWLCIAVPHLGLAAEKTTKVTV